MEIIPLNHWTNNLARVGRIALQWTFVSFHILTKALFLFGIGLILLNIPGLFIPLRNPTIYEFQDGKDITLTYREALRQIQRLPDENDEDYVYRLTHVLNQAMSQYWFDEGIDSHHMRIPIWDNYILWLYSYRNPKTYLKYEITDYRRALERGIGYCSQNAIVISEILEENGIDAKMIGISGHVIASANVNGKWYIVDPDYGVVVPHSLEEIESDPSIAYEHYKGFWSDELIASYFASTEDNYVFDNAEAYKGTKVFQFERKAYSAIWYIPLLLMTPFSMYKALDIAVLKRMTKR